LGKFLDSHKETKLTSKDKDPEAKAKFDKLKDKNGDYQYQFGELICSCDK